MRIRPRFILCGLVVILIAMPLPGTAGATEQGAAPQGTQETDSGQTDVGAAAPIDLSEKRTTDIISRGLVMPYANWMATPADIGAPYADVAIPNASGKKLSGWLIDRAGTDHTVLICMGNTGNMSHMLPYARFLYEAGFDVLMFDYQGFGKSEGNASILSIAGDAQAAWSYLRNHLGRPANELGVLGISLGSVLALMVAGIETPGAVAVEDVFQPRDFIEPLREDFGKNLAVRGSLWFLERTILPGVDPAANVGRIRCPVFLVHGATDWLLPPRATLDVAAAATSPPRVWLIDDVGHAPEPLVAVDREYAHQMARFFREAFEPAGPPVLEATFEVLDSGGGASDRDDAARTDGNDGASNLVRVRVEPKPSERVPVQVALGGAAGDLAFLRVFSDAPDECWTVRTDFVPDRAVAIEYGHVVDRDDGTWVEAYSNLGQSYRDYVDFRFNMRQRLSRSQQNKMLRHGKLAISVSAYDAEDWTWVRNNHPKARDVHERIRPRYARKLGQVAMGLDDPALRAEAIRMMLDFMPADPSTYYELGNAAFSLGFDDLFVARACLAAARAKADRGDLDAARGLARRYLDLLPPGLNPGLTQDQVDAVDSADDLVIAGFVD